MTGRTVVRHEVHLRYEGKEIQLEQGRKEAIRMFLKNKPSTPEMIAKALNISLSEVEEIAAVIAY